MFEVEVSGIEPFRNLVKALAAVVDEGCFNIDTERMTLLAMDPSHVAMVDFELPRGFFDGYRLRRGAQALHSYRRVPKVPGPG